MQYEREVEDGVGRGGSTDHAGNGSGGGVSMEEHAPTGYLTNWRILGERQ